MTPREAQHILDKLFGNADIRVNGDRPFDIQVHNEEFYQRVLRGGTLAFGESYMDGWWDCDALDELVTRVLRARLDTFLRRASQHRRQAIKSRLFNLQNTVRVHQVAAQHYDIGNDLYQAMLDTRLLYTCAYWKHARSLDEAQKAKLDLVCRKIGLMPGMTVLDLGCGFGSFAKFAAERYGAIVTGVNISREQIKLGRKLCAGLPVELVLDDYRNAIGTFDRVVSIGIMEHVGYKNYRTYMQTVNRTLHDDGIAFFHTIGSNVSYSISNSWTTKYIFPNGMLPSIAQLGKAMEGLFVMEDWHNFGPDYDRTLMAWYDNFHNAWPRLKDRYGERFYRMWRFYLLSAAGSFRSRITQLWQVVITKCGQPQPDCRIS